MRLVIDLQNAYIFLRYSSPYSFLNQQEISFCFSVTFMKMRSQGDYDHDDHHVAILITQPY